MSALDPTSTTLGDICTAALQECGRLGVGQTALAEDVQKAWVRCQWMLQEWERKRWLVYHLVTYSVVATGQTSYTFGPGGEINTRAVAAWELVSLGVIEGGFNYAVSDTITLTATPPSGEPVEDLVVTVLTVDAGAVLTVEVTSGGPYPGPLPNYWTQASTSGAGSNVELGYPVWGISEDQVTQASGGARPAKIESAFLRQIQIASPNQVDYPMRILQSMEDYNRIALKSLQSFPGAVFLDPGWPLAQCYFYPVPQASIYSINVSVMEQLPASFATLATALNLPFEYYSAIMYNLALRLRGPFQIPSYPGDQLPALAKNSLNVLRGANTAIAALGMPAQLTRPGIYNIFSDRNY